MRLAISGISLTLGLLLWGVTASQCESTLESPESQLPPPVRIDSSCVGEITDRDPIVVAPQLTASQRSPRAKSYPIEKLAGVHRIEMRSYFFDAYLVLRDSSGAVVAEGDDGFLRTHARLSYEFDASESYTVDAAAIADGRGPFTLELHPGNATELSRDARRQATLVDLNEELRVREAHFGNDHLRVAETLNELADEFKGAGQLEQSRQAYDRVVAIRTEAFGEDDLRVADAASELGRVLQLQGKYSQADVALRRALAIVERVQGPDHPNVAACLKNLASLLSLQGDFDEAERCLLKGIDIWTQRLGAESKQIGPTLSALALVYKATGQFERARPLYERALQIYIKTRGPRHHYVAAELNNLALLLKTQKKYDEALPLFQQAVEIWKEARGKRHRHVAHGLNNLAAIMNALGRRDEAQSLYQEALDIREEVYGPDHPEVAVLLNNLGLRALDRGEFEHAQQLLQRALSIWEQSLGAAHRNVAAATFNLATLARKQGETPLALELLQRSFDIREQSLGESHPSTIQSLSSLALVHADLVHADLVHASEAQQYASRAVSRSQKQLLQQLVLSSESDALINAEQHKAHIETLISTTPTGTDATATYAAVLHWKGQVTRVFGQSKQRLFSQLSDADRNTIQQLRRTQAQLSSVLAMSRVEDKDERDQRLQTLRKQRDQLEAQLQRIGATQLQLDPLTPAQLAAALPQGSVWIDFLEHRRYRPAAAADSDSKVVGVWLPPELTAWILRPTGELKQVSLGPSADLRAAIRQYVAVTVGARATTGNRGLSVDEDPTVTTIDPRPSRDHLYRALWQPLAPFLGDAAETGTPEIGTRQIILCPDAYIGALPFEIIEDDESHFLIERFAFRYVQDSSAMRHLTTRAPTPRAPFGDGGLIAIGAIDYAERGSATPDAKSPTEDPPGEHEIAGDVTDIANTTPPHDLRGDFAHAWEPLAQTEAEVRSIAELHRESFEATRRSLVQGTEATEERLKAQLPEFSVIHLATHGYFEPKILPSMQEQLHQQRSQQAEMSPEEQLVSGYFPGLLSGLVCAGANQARDPSRDNGLLTAEEVSWLDLSRCNLVVLSACQTALGSTRSGQGMMGLRRAFHQAGARHVVSSLWKVEDDATCNLMVQFYRNLWNSQLPPLESLRSAQLQMLQQNRTEAGEPRPATWGAFVLSSGGGG